VKTVVVAVAAALLLLLGSNPNSGSFSSGTPVQFTALGVFSHLAGRWDASLSPLHLIERDKQDNTEA
jgi:hypothetical protein